MLGGWGGRGGRAWRKVTADYRPVYGFGHLRADCRGRDQLRNPTIVSSMGLHLPTKKRSEETQTLHAVCNKVEPKNFAPLQTPSRGLRTAKI